MKEKIIFCLFFIVLLTFSCSKERKPLVTFDISNNISNMDFYFVRKNLSLNIPANIYLPEITQYVQSDSKSNYYLCSLNEIYRFDSLGNYNNKLSAVGRGPGEYSMIGTFCLDNEENIYLIDGYNSNIMIYDSEFNFIKKIEPKTLVNFRFSLIYKNKYLICFAPYSTENAVYVFEVKSGTCINKFGRRDELMFKYFSFIDIGGIYLDKDTLYYMNTHEYKIYKYTVFGELLDEITPDSKSFIQISKKRGNVINTMGNYSIIMGLTMVNDLMMILRINPTEGKDRGRISYDLVTKEGKIVSENKYFENPRNPYLLQKGKNTFMALHQPQYDKDSINTNNINPSLEIFHFKY